MMRSRHSASAGSWHLTRKRTRKQDQKITAKVVKELTRPGFAGSLAAEPVFDGH